MTIEPRRNTRLVLVKFEHRDPALAAEITNALARQYAKYNLDLKLKGAQDALAWLTEQMSGLKNKVKESSVALQNYRVKSGIMGLQEQRQITAQKIMDFNKAYLEAQAQRLSVEAKMNELARIAADRGGIQTIFTVADNTLIQKLKQEAAELDVQKSKLLKTYKDKHPEVLKVQAQIDQVAQRIDGEIKTLLRAVQTEFRVARAREETLLGNVNQLRKEGQELNEKEIQYLAPQRESDSNQQLYEAVLKRLKETGVARQSVGRSGRQPVPRGGRRRARRRVAMARARRGRWAVAGCRDDVSLGVSPHRDRRRVRVSLVVRAGQGDRRRRLRSEVAGGGVVS